MTEDVVLKMEVIFADPIMLKLHTLVILLTSVSWYYIRITLVEYYH